MNRRTEFKVTRYKQAIENDADVDATDRYFDNADESDENEN